MDTPAASLHRLPFPIAAWWATGSVGVAIMSSLFGILLLRYMTDVVGLAASMAGLLIAGSKIYDAVIDPLVGRVSDRLKSTQGRRRPFVAAGGLLGGASIVFMFSAPRLHSPWQQVYFVGVVLFFTTAYSMLQVPYMAMAAEMTDGYLERSRLMGFRLYGGIIGQLLAVGLAPWLLFLQGGGAGAYRNISFLLGAIIVASSFAAFWGTRRAPFTVAAVEPAKTSGFGLRAFLKPLRENRPLGLILLAKVFVFGAAGVAGVLPFYNQQYLGLSDKWLGLFVLVSTISMLVSTPCWIWLNRWISKKHLVLIAMMSYAAVALSWLLVPPHASPIAPLTLLALSAAAVAGTTLLMQSIFIDTVAFDYAVSGERREGVLNGLFSLTEKVSAAIGVSLIGFVLSASGYIAGAKAAHQSTSAIHAIQLLWSLTPALAYFCAMLVVTRYRLDDSMRSQSFADGEPTPEAA